MTSTVISGRRSRGTAWKSWGDRVRRYSRVADRTAWPYWSRASRSRGGGVGRHLLRRVAEAVVPGGQTKLLVPAVPLPDLCLVLGEELDPHILYPQHVPQGPAGGVGPGPWPPGQLCRGQVLDHLDQELLLPVQGLFNKGVEGHGSILLFLIAADEMARLAGPAPPCGWPFPGPAAAGRRPGCRSSLVAPPGRSPSSLPPPAR
jgi:hypothetical protein